MKHQIFGAVVAVVAGMASAQDAPAQTLITDAHIFDGLNGARIQSGTAQSPFGLL